MEANKLEFLKSEENQEILHTYADLNESELDTLLLKLHKKGVKNASDLILQLKLRNRAQEKFSKADKMYFTRDGLEQATSESVARHIAKRFEKGNTTLDLTCGIGGNAIFFGEENRVIAYDIDEEVLSYAKHNASIYGVDKNIEFHNENVISTELRKADYIFIDPSRRSTGSKVVSIADSIPDVFSLFEKMSKINKNICIKISPAFDYVDLEGFDESPEVEIVSDQGVNRVTLLWFGELKQHEKTATVLNYEGEDIIFHDSNSDEESEIRSSIGGYLFDPDPAITKSHLVNEVAVSLGLDRIDGHLGFLTFDELGDPKRLPGRVFKTIKWDKFSMKELERSLVELGFDAASIVNRGFRISPDEVRKKLHLKESSENFVLLMKLDNEDELFAICQRVF